MSDATTAMEALPLEERGWRMAVLDELSEFCLSTARIIYAYIHQTWPERTDRSSWPWMLGRMVRMMRELKRLSKLTREGVPPPEPCAPRTRRPVTERASRSLSWEPRASLSLADAGVPGAPAFQATLGYLLGPRDVAALVAADPRAARLVRSLCRLCGVRPEDVLFPLPPDDPDQSAGTVEDGGSGFDWAALCPPETESASIVPPEDSPRFTGA